MKRIRLLPATEEDGQGYREMLLIVARTPTAREAGMDIDEMRRSLRLLDAIEPKAEGEVVELEDADHTLLAAKLHSMRWIRADRHLVRFVDAVLNATDTVPDEQDGVS